MKKSKKIAAVVIFTLSFFFIGSGMVSAHYATSTCESITLFDDLPAGTQTAVLTPGNITVPGSGTFAPIAAGNYTITWADGVVATNNVVSSCSTASNFAPVCSATPPSTTRVEQDANSIAYTGVWLPNSLSTNSSGSATLSMEAGSSAIFTFTGTSANWIGYSDEWSGIANVYVDGVLKTTVDTYSSPSKSQYTEYSIAGLSMGTHTLKVEATATKNPLSGGLWVWVDGFEAGCNNTTAALPATITVVKTVINDNGGTKVVSDFPLFVNTVVAPDPSTLVVSGVTNTFPAPAAYTVTETSDPNYTQSFSGDCDSSGNISLVPGDHKFCIITNDDIAPAVIPPTPPGGGGPIITPPIPPLIDVVKVPTPLALPNGPGPVTYTYTLRNVGLVPVSNITMVGDSCSPITLFTGDTNGDSKLDINETWVYGCSTTLAATHTNTVVATGWANGISAVDIASATVVVGTPGVASASIAVPPLIHVTKIPNPLALPIGGGMVTYTNLVTNPGTVPLSNVQLTDDKCGPVNYMSGDTNGDSKLDTNEAWIYTCQTNLTKTTTNTIIAQGQANGFTVRDLAIATVVVAIPALPNTGVPGLPNTGYAPLQKDSSFIFILAGILLFSISRFLSIKKRRV